MENETGIDDWKTNWEEVNRCLEWMGRWRCSILLGTLLTSTSKYPTPYFCRPFTPLRYLPFPSNPISRFFRFFPFSALPSPASVYANDFVSGSHDFPHDYIFQPREDDGSEKIPVKAFFLCTRSAASSSSFICIYYLFTWGCFSFFVFRFLGFIEKIVEKKTKSWIQPLFWRQQNGLLFWNWGLIASIDKNLNDIQISFYCKMCLMFLFSFSTHHRKGITLILLQKRMEWIGGRH